MKSRINHLLLIIVLAKGIHDSWINIRKIIFTQILNKLTLPLEAASLLKIKEKYVIDNQK